MRNHGEILRSKIVVRAVRPPSCDLGERAGSALPRAARAALGLPLTLTGFRRSEAALAELPELTVDRALLLRVAAARGSGLLALAPEVVQAVTEARALGRVGRAPPAPRRPTRLDAALMEPFAQALTATLGELLDLPPPAVGPMIDEARLLPVVLDEGTYTVLALDLRLGDDPHRDGRVLLALPLAVPACRPGEPEMPREADPGWQSRFQTALSEAPADLDAAFPAVTLPLSAILGLRPGSVLALPGASVSVLELRDADGRRVSQGRLGRLRGHRAIRLTDPAAAPPGPAAGRADMAAVPGAPPHPAGDAVAAGVAAG